jgi:hypothetical protein
MKNWLISKLGGITQDEFAEAIDDMNAGHAQFLAENFDVTPKERKFSANIIILDDYRNGVIH